jgi:zinc transport system substrate-binding protein
MPHRRPLTVAVLGLVFAGLATGCGAGNPREPGAPIRVVTGFYPLQYVAQQVGGDRVNVSDLVQPGAEPHDLELSPRQVADVADADLVVYLAGFQPAVDEAVGLDAADSAFDVGTVVALLAAPSQRDRPDASDTETAAGGKDPHLWLDPTRLAGVADSVGQRLATIDPAGAAGYQSRAADLRARLTRLDREYSERLGDCDRRDIVVNHAAFGYLAQRYHLAQIAITGLEPDAEPTPQRLAEVAGAARAHGATTVFFETLVSPAVAKAIAGEVGARTAVLDPIEGLPVGSGEDYESIMRSNLNTLTAALGCS